MLTECGLPTIVLPPGTVLTPARSNLPLMIGPMHSHIAAMFQKYVLIQRRGNAQAVSGRQIWLAVLFSLLLLNRSGISLADNDTVPVDKPTDKQLHVVGSDPSTPAWKTPDEFPELHPSALWPAIRPEHRPGAIWWWPASAVTRDDLTWNLETYARAGWGNMGIVGIYGVQGEEDKFIDLFTPEWFDMYNHTVGEAARLGINIDLTPGGGWRWGGPHVTSEQTEQKFSVADGKLVIKTLQEEVKRAGPGGIGSTVNPYSRDAVRFHLDWFDEKMSANKAPAPRSFYYDSFENQGNWCDEFLAEFQQRRGYSLKDHAQALAEKADSQQDRRILCDYRETLSDLLIERLREIAQWGEVKGSQLRLQAHGAPANLLDLYAAGSIPETEVFGASKFDIPGFRRDGKWIRADQQSDLVNRFASSAAHVAGHPITTSESFTWLRNHYHTALSHIKAEADGLLLNGINGIYYHGACFSPKETAWPGWLFYASTQANPRNSIFRDVPILNAYITRCQSVLQSGMPHNDILLYWPVHDLWMGGGKDEQRYTVHHPAWIEKTRCGDVGRFLLKNGFTFDFVSDRQLAATNFVDQKLETEGGSRYQVVLVPAAKHMSVQTATKIVELAKQGATVLVWQSLPQEVPGWHQHQQRKSMLNQLWKELTLTDGVAKVGSGKIVVGSDLQSLLATSNVQRESMADLGLQFIRRVNEDQVSYFVVNHTKASVDQSVPVATSFKSATCMDPMTGRVGTAQVKADETNSVYLQLQPGETRILKLGGQRNNPPASWDYPTLALDDVPVRGKWAIEFVEGGPELPASSSMDQLDSWTKLSDPKTQSFAGAARYTIDIEIPSRPGVEGWLLDLGDVRESARVWVNGHPAGVVVAHPFRIDVGSLIHAGNNRIEIEVTNLSANRIRDLDRRKVNWKKFHDINFVSHRYRPFDASQWDIEPSGLLGPVKLFPYATKREFSAAKPTLHLIGDSLVKTGSGQGGNGQWGWGSVIEEHFDADKITIRNHAIGGLSSRTYRTGGHWDKVVDQIQPGDLVIMHFGHNDGGEKFKGNRPRASIEGNGDETVEGIVELTGKSEIVHSYGWYLRKYIADTHERGATPIVVSSVPRKSWNGDHVIRSDTGYGLWARQAAESAGAPFFNLNGIVADQYDSLGKTRVESLFADAHTHTTLDGAKLNARCVVAGLWQLKECDLSEYLKTQSQDLNLVSAARNKPQRKPTLYLIGDSTVKNGKGDQVGWGEAIGKYFDTDDIAIANHAVGGRSTRTFYREQRWQKVFDLLQPGDFVIMQFGHNDGGYVGDARYKRRPSLHGVGDDTKEVTHDDGTVEIVHSYGWYLKHFCEEAHSKGAMPIICTPVPHKNNWNDGIFTADFDGNRSWCREVASQTGATFIDLTAIVGDRYQAMGEKKVDALFADARTHTNAAGADINAQCVVAGLRILNEKPFADYFSRGDGK